ncbi:helix-turn-helix transcriptional regulator [Heyndrickxia oleronia]|uniref:Transcriptional regulator n=1 Tax=Heyndrickxia oleronia TaxID=38875 RepID=A0A8E2LHG5_9BACI|nr:helix-turn-helix transcriptional regulator [Heyndrickxia oleronia]NYV66921.1 helix-turn-helix transcriptional regulator [Bacillus sp. Gen3]MBU5213932.1 helix-turn-helix transcriptional regulator [Heyndrickxia oleronia]MCM3455684.1 helix-turn-helix transcriptional regulator [Heyndrickxia oleronia]MEC1375603.1 helix-turn-helix transcriptional regulator [Heyndrickxia oleronia]OOP70224.1 transcriptional regulator [Heyndrickxia oleronia]
MKNKIKEVRKKLGLTQEDLAKECGVVRQTINCVENDKYDPTLELAFKLSKILRVKVDALFIYE